jgi:outer membrane protein TolC
LSQPLAVGLASLSLPFLDWRNLDIQRKQARIDFKQESLAYRQTVHRALREVDEALRLRDLLRSEHQHLRQELALARKAEGDAVVRHQAGDVDLLTVYRAQLRRGDLEDRLVSLRFEQLANLADLFQAMGGAPEIIENAPASG